MIDQKILILELGGIGDVVMSLPAVETVIRGVGNVTVLTVKRTQPIIETLRGKGYNNFSIVSTGAMEGAGLSGWLSIIKTLRCQQFDMVIDLSAIETFKSAVKRRVFLKALSSKKTIGRNTEGRGWAFNEKASENLTNSEHEAERKIRVIELMGLKTVSLIPGIFISREEREKADKFLSGLADDGKLIVGINPGAYRPSRMWPEEKFREVMEWLVNDMSASIIITGGGKERLLAERLSGPLPAHRVKTALNLPIIELAAVLEKINVFVTNDTGPMHVAAAVNVPTVALFGQTNLHRYHPYMDSSRYVAIKRDYTRCPYFSFRHPMEECRRYDCEGKNCMKEITVDEVKAAIKRLLATQYPGLRDV